MRTTTSIAADCLIGTPQDLGGSYYSSFDLAEDANLASDTSKLSRLHSALEIDGKNVNLLWKILEVQFKVYGSWFLGNAPIFLTIGELYEAESELQIAEEVYLEALAIIENKDNERHSALMGRALLNLYSLYEKAGDNEKLAAIEARLSCFWNTRYVQKETCV
jgi:tetratricopeptide (TPR) repeat protein